ncbi:hypothetical protein AVEN_226289-1 [Araneus ventricosus]|uniref:Uncharacterized protein n=1 Tax=Araneus ventricosus TaxID=182803 RepID=A0A4Y2DB40_ARAVE|nr:hypothetical protein AVEN_226289-1 [Araneus ventricosus]
MWDGPRIFEPRSDDEDDTWVGTSSPSFRTGSLVQVYIVAVFSKTEEEVACKEKVGSQTEEEYIFLWPVATQVDSVYKAARDPITGE